jgi:hypothetical protein
LLLCGEHHRALHKGEFTIVALGDQSFQFTGSDGVVYESTPPMEGSADELVAARPLITPATVEPDWDGTPMYKSAVAGYFAIWNQMIRKRRAATGADNSMNGT